MDHDEKEATIIKFTKNKNKKKEDEQKIWKVWKVIVIKFKDWFYQYNSDENSFN